MQPDLRPTTTPPAGGPSLVQPALRWAVIDLMGHRCIAGAVSYEDVGDVRLVRVDVPEIVTLDDYIPAHSCSFGAPAIFSIAWCDEAAALAAARLMLHRPPGSTKVASHG